MSLQPDFSGQSILVTGAARGLGRSMATRLAQCGARVGLLDVDEAGCRTAADELRAGGAQVEHFAVDVSRRAQLLAAADATRAVASARVELRTIVAGPTGPVALVHRGAFTDGGVRARAESDMSEVAAALEAAGQELDGDWSQPTGIVVDGDSVFSQLGPMAEALGRAPHDWARARLSEVAGPASVADNDTLALALDPLGPLDILRHPVVEVVELGVELGTAPARLLEVLLDGQLLGADLAGDEEDESQGDVPTGGQAQQERLQRPAGGLGVGAVLGRQGQAKAHNCDARYISTKWNQFEQRGDQTDRDAAQSDRVAGQSVGENAQPRT